MSDHSQLAAFWRSRLSASEEQFANGSPHLRWLRRMYIRVYRFLLSQYGEATESPPLGETPVSLMPLVDNTDRHGRPPKQPGKIQAILKDIHVANERLDKPGPLAKGLAAQDWIVIATRRDRWWPHRCVGLLRRSGVAARVVGCGRDAVVEVKRSDAEDALKILGFGGAYLRVGRSGNDVYRTSPWDAALQGAVVGSAAGMMMGYLLTWAVIGDWEIERSDWAAVASAITAGSYVAGGLIGAWTGWKDIRVRT